MAALLTVGRAGHALPPSRGIRSFPIDSLTQVAEDDLMTIGRYDDHLPLGSAVERHRRSVRFARSRERG
jgi:hypothetical protein